MFDFWDLQLQILVLTLPEGKLSSRTSCIDFAPTNWPASASASASAELFCGPLTSVALLLLLFLNIFLVADGFGLVTPALSSPWVFGLAVDVNSGGNAGHD